MRSTLLLLAALALPGVAGAQIVGGGVGGAAGALGGQVAVPTAPVVNAGRAATDAVRGAQDAPTAAAASADRGGRRVRVKAGASIRVDQGTRCYYDDYTYDPVYRDGAYYCERTGPGASAGAKVGSR